MDTVTYPDAHVSRFIAEHFIPVQIKIKEEPETANKYGVHWTPNLVVADEEGRGTDHYRVEGFLPPEELLPRLALGTGKYWLDRNQFPKAIERFQEVADRHQGTDLAAEALYWLGVANYKQSKDPARLRSSWSQLTQSYPASEWAKRANVPKKS